MRHHTEAWFRIVQKKHINLPFQLSFYHEFTKKVFMCSFEKYLIAHSTIWHSSEYMCNNIQLCWITDYRNWNTLAGSLPSKTGNLLSIEYYKELGYFFNNILKRTILECMDSEIFYHIPQNDGISSLITFIYEIYNWIIEWFIEIMSFLRRSFSRNLDTLSLRLHLLNYAWTFFFQLVSINHPFTRNFDL